MHPGLAFVDGKVRFLSRSTIMRVGPLLGRVGLGHVCRDWTLHLVSEPTLEVSRARGDNCAGMLCACAWIRRGHGMAYTCAGTGPHKRVEERRILG